MPVPIEDVVYQVPRDARTVVLHIEAREAVDRVGRHLDHSADGNELHRIAQEVGQDLEQAIAVADHLDILDGALHARLPVLAGEGMERDSVRHQPADLERAGLYLEPAGLDSTVVGRAHARQMDAATRKEWRAEILGHHSRRLDAPSWLWSSVVALVGRHEHAYLEHCRRYALHPSGLA